MHGNHRHHNRQCDEPETVNQRIAAGNGGGQANAQGGNQRHRHHVGGDAAGVIGQANDFLGRKPGDNHHGDVTDDHEPVQRVAENNPEHPQGNHQAHGHRHQHPQGEGVNPALTDGLRLLGHGNQRRFGNHRGKAHGKAERQQN